MLYVVLCPEAYEEGRDEVDRGASDQPMTQVCYLLSLTSGLPIYWSFTRTHICRYLKRFVHHRGLCVQTVYTYWTVI